MAAYDSLLNIVRDYFVDLGYNPQYIVEFFSNNTFKEVASVRLANANIMIRNKSDRSSHQTHIAITGEMIEFFYSLPYFADLDAQTIEYRDIAVSNDNIEALKNNSIAVKNPFEIVLSEGKVTLGKRTQKQVQLSKKNQLNSECFNALRLGLYENDLLIMLKYRATDRILCIGIPQTFYLDVFPDYVSKFETNTYLRLPAIRN